MGAFDFYVLAALTFSIIVACHGKPPQPEDIGTNFFLKASKSVPRIGRRTMEYENYFLKPMKKGDNEKIIHLNKEKLQASKSIPRIGRRTLTSSTEADYEGTWQPKDMEDPIKRSFFEKYFKENEPPVWSDLEKIYQDYPGAFQGDEPYPDAGISPKQDPYWPRTKKDGDVQEEPQNKKK